MTCAAGEGIFVSFFFVAIFLQLFCYLLARKRTVVQLLTGPVIDVFYIPFCQVLCPVNEIDAAPSIYMNQLFAI